MILLGLLFINVAFFLMLMRLSSWYNLKREDYGFHLICLNLTALLLVLNENMDIFIEYPFSIKLFSALALVYGVLGFFRKRMIYLIRVVVDRIKNK